MNSLYLDTALLIWAYMTLLFLISWWKRDNSIVDVGWGLGFVVITWYLHFQYPHSWSWLPALLVSVWGGRLAWHIGWRKVKQGKEDWRYAKWREEWGQWVIPRSYLQVFLLQGFFMWVIALPFMQRPVPEALLWYQWAGILLWLVGFLWEAVSDWQLQRFKARPDNKGKIMTEGLWRLSRHPNYFGEIVLWWGIWLLLLPCGSWYLSLASPVVLTWLLTRVSGVPMLEKKYEGRPDFEAYKKETPPLVPDWRKL
ncbi:MAG: DUF1295 domain-containing protein [Lewinellaceae bacterium]|nr:DUF1295 domain-containing protein [Lewinellaceae bacterium]